MMESSPSRTSSECARLLDDLESPLAEHSDSWSSPGPSTRGLSRDQLSLSLQARLIPVIVATELACQLPTTTFVELMRLTICKVLHGSDDGPVTFLLGGPGGGCEAPDVVKYFAFVTTILGVVDSLLCATTFGLLSHRSSRSGRKPALLVLLTIAITGCCLVVGSQFAPNWLLGWVFLLGVLFRMVAGSAPHGYLFSLYVTDMCTAEERTAALSKMVGFAMLGVSISLSLGGFITTKTGNPLIVFYMAAMILAVTFVYVLFFVPESLKERRVAFARAQPEHSNHSPSTARQLSSLFIPILRLLKALAPTRKSDGTRNWRLIWCTTHNFIFTIVNHYAPSAWMVLVTSKYHLTPAETGLFVSIVTISGTVILIVILPFLVRLLRPFYARKTMLHLPEGGIDALHLDAGTSDHLDVHLSFVICIIVAVSYLGAAASTTPTGIVISAIFVGFAFMRGPTLRSLVVGSIDPLKQGEVLAAYETVSSLSGIISPIIMGSILTRTIDSMPLLFFQIHLVVVLLSGVLLFLIRDADRYQTPQSEL